MEVAARLLDTGNEQGSAGPEAAVTRAEKDRVITDILVRYQGHVGDVVVNDDGALARLLTTLQFDDSDVDVGEYLCSYLVA